jgi:hypothetical protein
MTDPTRDDSAREPSSAPGHARTHAPQPLPAGCTEGEAGRAGAHAVESFTTVSGSAYEVDLLRRLIRRTGNAAGRQPTPYQGSDGTWRCYHSVAVLTSKEGWSVVLIDWDGTGAVTFTSAVVTLSPGIAAQRLDDGPEGDPR